MPLLTQGTDATITFTRQRNGVPIPIDDAATVRGQFFTQDGETAVSPEVTALSTDEFAAWHTGLVAFQVSASDTAALATPDSLFYVWITDPGAAEPEEWTIRFHVLTPADLRGTALFPDQAHAIRDLRRRIAASGGLTAQLAKLPDGALWGALQAAETDAEHASRVFFSPVEILPETAPQAERDALDLAGTRWIEEPGYDLDDEFFSGDRWGYLVTRQRPIVAIRRLTFIYPFPLGTVFEVPPDWIRADKKYGHVRLVPGSQSFAAPAAVWTMRVMGGGRTIPQMIQLRYAAGLKDAARQFPELVDLVRRMALLRLLQGMFLPAAGSISADGLSESASVDLSKEEGDIEAHLERLRQVIHGIQVTFV